MADHAAARVLPACVGGDLTMDAADRYAGLVDELTALPGVEPPGQRRGFGSNAVTTGGAIFAMLADGRLVVKLPRDRVAELIRAGRGAGFHAGKGRPMKEWLTVLDEQSWGPLAHEAYAFVSTRRR